MRAIKNIPLLILVIFFFGTAAAQEKPAATGVPAPIVTYQSKSPIIIQGNEYNFLTIVIDIPQGAGFPEHYHGGHVLVTVLSGEITLKQEGVEKVVKTGESWTEDPGARHSVVNKGASARVVASMLVPKGEEVTTFVQ